MVLVDINLTFIAGQSVCSTHCSSTTASSKLSDILALPKPKAPQKKRRQAVNSKAQCITDIAVLQELKAKEQEKVQKEEEKRMRKLERQRKKEAKLKCKRATRKTRAVETSGAHMRPTRSRKNKSDTPILKQLQILSLTSGSETSQSESEAESEAECPKCGLVYGEDNSVWIQCDGCGLWWDLRCSGVDADNIPDTFNCETCS